MISFYDVIMTVHVDYDVIIFNWTNQKSDFEKILKTEILDSDWS